MYLLIVKTVTGETFKRVFPIYDEALTCKKKLFTSLYSVGQVDFKEQTTIFKSGLCFIDIVKQNDYLDNL